MHTVVYVKRIQDVSIQLKTDHLHYYIIYCLYNLFVFIEIHTWDIWKTAPCYHVHFNKSRKASWPLSNSSQVVQISCWSPQVLATKKNVFKAIYLSQILIYFQTMAANRSHTYPMPVRCHGHICDALVDSSTLINYKLFINMLNIHTINSRYDFIDLFVFHFLSLYLLERPAGWI